MPAPRFRHTFESAALALSLLACSAPTPTEAPSTPVPAATAAPPTATTQSTPLALPTPAPRAALGVYTASVDAAWRHLLGFGQEAGAVVVAMVVGSPAARAGILEGDVVLALDDQPVRNAPESQRRTSSERVAGRTCTSQNHDPASSRPPHHTSSRPWTTTHGPLNWRQTCG